jgi:hypothetical protein
MPPLLAAKNPSSQSRPFPCLNGYLYVIKGYLDSFALVSAAAPAADCLLVLWRILFEHFLDRLEHLFFISFLLV